MECLPFLLLLESNIEIECGLFQDLDDFLHFKLGVLIFTDLTAVRLRSTLLAGLLHNSVNLLLMLLAFNFILKLLLVLLQNGFTTSRILIFDEVQREVILIDFLVVKGKRQKLLVEEADRFAFQSKRRLLDFQLFTLLWRHRFQKSMFVVIIRVKSWNCFWRLVTALSLRCGPHWLSLVVLVVHHHLALALLN